MALNPTTPETKDVSFKVSQEKTLDVYHIEEMIVRLDPNDAANHKVILTWSSGFVDGEGQYVRVNEYHEVIMGPDLGEKFVEVVNDRTVYDTVKIACWELLQARGLVPAGSIV